MGNFSQKWAIVSLLEEAEEGSEFYYTDFPLHVTLAGVFAINKNGEELKNELTKLLKDQQPVQVKADEKDMFGPAGDIAVMKIKKTPELMELYETIHEWLEGAGVEFNSPEYQGSGYIPHCTTQKSGSLKQREERILKSVSLIDLYPNKDGHRRKILKTVSLLKASTG